MAQAHRNRVFHDFRAGLCRNLVSIIIIIIIISITHTHNHKLFLRVIIDAMEALSNLLNYKFQSMLLIYKLHTIINSFASNI